jgi:predicted GNAT superfamily acetyltransferase
VSDPDTAVHADADACARKAADGCQVVIADLREITEHEAGAELLCRVWGARSPDQLVNVSLLRALAHSGNYVVGAYRDSRLLGVAVAFFGAGHLHSHITGVDRSGQSAGVGYALKQHQRAWALARGVTAVRWTYDPLVRRNAYFNLHKLGAYARDYLPEFYGAMDDGVNTGDTTDRLYVSWELTSPEAVAAAHGGNVGAEAAALRDAGAAVALDRIDNEPVKGAGHPGSDERVKGPGHPARDEALLVAMPADIEALRARDLTAALRWRRAVREALSEAFTRGYMISDVTRDGYYLLAAG